MGGQRRRIVGRARQQDGRSLRSLRDQDDGVQLDAVPHRNHHVAPDVVEARVGRLKRRRRFARQGRSRLRRLCQGRADEQQQRCENRGEYGANTLDGHQEITSLNLITGERRPCPPS